MLEVIKFETMNCKPCKIIQGVLDKVADVLKDKPVTFIVLDAIQHSDRAKELNVSKAPTVIVLEDGKEIHRFVGSLFKQEDFLAVLRPLVEKTPTDI